LALGRLDSGVACLDRGVRGRLCVAARGAVRWRGDAGDRAADRAAEAGALINALTNREGRAQASDVLLERRLIRFGCRALRTGSIHGSLGLRERGLSRVVCLVQ